MYLKKRTGFWVEVRDNGRNVSAIHCAKPQRYMAEDLRQHNIGLGYQVTVIDCETGLAV